MYHVSAQGVDELMINVHYYYYYVECLWPGWATECEVVQNGVVKKSVWCEMVA